MKDNWCECMHLVPYDKKLLFGEVETEEIKETIVEEPVETTEDCVYNPLYSGSRIRWMLKEKGVSQARVARLLKVSQSQFANMLAGRRDLTEEMVKKIAEYLGVSMEELTGCKCIETEEAVEEGKKEVDTVVAGVKIYDLVGFKHRIRGWLGTRGMKTRDLAGMLGFDERDIRINRWFHGSENPTMSDLKKLSEVMGCEISWLVGEDIEETLSETRNRGEDIEFYEKVEEEVVEAPVLEEIEEKNVEEPRVFKDIIAEYMVEKGLSKKGFGKLTGIDSSTVCRWFNADTLPGPKLLQRIIDATGLNFDGVKIYEGKTVEVDPNKERVVTTLSKNIRAFMIKKGLNQAEFSRLVNCNRASLYAWLNDGRIPGKDHMAKISEIMGMSIEELLGESTGVETTERDLVGDFSEHMTPPGEMLSEKVEEEPETKPVVKSFVHRGKEIRPSSLTYDWDERRNPTTEEVMYSRWPAKKEEETHVETTAIDTPVAPTIDMELLKEQMRKEIMAEVTEDIVRRTREEVTEDIVRRTREEVTENPNQRRVVDLRKAVQKIFDNAESIVGNTTGTGNLTVSICLHNGEAPHVNVDYDIYF